MAGPIGAFIWYEYMGEDRLAAADFYAHVLGWTVKDAGMPNLPYETASVGERMVAGLMEIPDDARAMGVRPCWTGYIWVEDVDAMLPDLTRAGGKAWKQPAEFPGVGRFAVVADPYGGGIVLFHGHGDGPPPAPPENAPGFVGWHEFHADDGAAALDFYCRFFGWKRTSEFDMGPMGGYQMFKTSHGERGGVMTRRPGVSRLLLALLFQRRGDRRRRGARARPRGQDRQKSASGSVRPMGRPCARSAGRDVRPCRARAVSERGSRSKGGARRAGAAIALAGPRRPSDRSRIAAPT